MFLIVGDGFLVGCFLLGFFFCMWLIFFFFFVTAEIQELPVLLISGL